MRAPPPHAPFPGVTGGGVSSGGEPAAHQPPRGRARGRRGEGGRPQQAPRPPMLAVVGGGGFPGRQLRVGALQTRVRIPDAGQVHGKGMTLCEGAADISCVECSLIGF
ncbi:hypothetical protein CEXT_482991 [Caerostris extrusa]|uniref:Uncharacterized protein n=1 Tax=Caerostris extrusa TaxID=172846 RepID=A0AAV4VAZ8_CAEEX|nr:hypothetical protein CEXT_482991 [Caerostris extrusa]